MSITVYCVFSVIRQGFFFFQNSIKDLDPSFNMDLDLCDCLGQNSLKDLDPSCKMDLDFCDCLGREKPIL